MTADDAETEDAHAASESPDGAPSAAARERSTGVGAVVGALEGGLGGAFAGALVGSCCFFAPFPRPPASVDPELGWLQNVILFFTGAGAALAAGDGAAARIRAPVVARLCLIVSGLVAPLAGAAPAISLSAFRAGVLPWRLDPATNKYYHPGFLLLLGLALAAGQGLMLPPARAAHLEQGVRLGGAALAAVVVLWIGLGALQPGADQSLFTGLFLVLTAATIAVPYALGRLAASAVVGDAARLALEPDDVAGG